MEENDSACQNSSFFESIAKSVNLMNQMLKNQRECISQKKKKTKKERGKIGSYKIFNDVVMQ